MFHSLKKILGVLATVIIGIGVGIFLWRASSTSTSPATSSSTHDKVQVVTSFYPLTEFAQQIGGDKVAVTNLTPAGAEPHDFEPTPQDMITLQKAKLFIFNGAGFENWVNQVLPEIPESATVVNSSENISLIENDPHIWLDPVLAQTQLENITRGLVFVDEKNRLTYQSNTQKYLHELRQLDEEFRTGLSTCQKRDIVTSHDAFQYLAKRYNLNIISLSGLSPDEEPSPKKMAEVSRFIQENKIEYIFFESLVSPKLADTIAKETGAKTLLFNPLEGLTTEELERGENYLSVQRKNLQNLKTALHCQ